MSASLSAVEPSPLWRDEAARGTFMVVCDRRREVEGKPNGLWILPDEAP